MKRARRNTDNYEYGRWNNVEGAQGLSKDRGSFDVVNLDEDKTYQFRILFKVGNEIGFNDKMIVDSEISKLRRIHVFVHPCICSPIHLCIHLFNLPFIQSFRHISTFITYLFIHPFSHPSFHECVHLSMHLVKYIFFHQFIHSIPPFIHSINSFIHPILTLSEDLSYIANRVLARFYGML